MVLKFVIAIAFEGFNERPLLTMSEIAETLKKRITFCIKTVTLFLPKG